MCLKNLIVIGLFLVGIGGTPLLRADDPDAAAVHKRLEYFVGNWDVAVKFKLPDGKEGGGKSALKTEWIVNNKFIREAYDSKFMGQPLSIWQMRGFDNTLNKWVEFQLHAEGEKTHTMQLDGPNPSGDAPMTLSGDSLDSMTKKPVKLRTVTTIVDPDHYRLEWYMTRQGEKEERTVVLEHTRKK